MRERIVQIHQEIREVNIASKGEAEAFRIKYLGSKGLLKSLYQEFKQVPNEQKKEVGQMLNDLKQALEDKVNALTFSSNVEQGQKQIDLSRPGRGNDLGSIHPLTLTRNEIIRIFEHIGFTISEGPEIEDDWHNFTALNTPIDHPARDMQDTFYIDHPQEYVLRTQTSSVQVRLMEQQQPPIRTMSPGRVYRNEAISARAHCQFHQIEGLYVDDKVSFADLKQTLSHFIHQFFGSQTKIRMRPSYFPFTEPSAEVDVSCTLCSGKGCNVCKHSGWLEVMGCGMVDPQVFENCGIDAKRYSGFAFGMGIERLAMLKFGIKDLRLFFENDLRFLNQFRRS